MDDQPKIDNSHKTFFFIVPPPIEIKIIDDIIKLREPIIYPHGNILRYEIVAMQNSSEPILLNTSTMDVPTSMLLTEPGTYSVKVCDQIYAYS